jgi:hypothetical protein
LFGDPAQDAACDQPAPVGLLLHDVVRQKCDAALIADQDLLRG